MKGILRIGLLGLTAVAQAQQGSGGGTGAQQGPHWPSLQMGTGSTSDGLAIFTSPPLQPQLPAKDTKYILLEEVDERVEGVTYAISCFQTTPADCGAVYAKTQKLVPFASLKDALDYLNGGGHRFVMLYVVTPVEVKVKETTTEVPQPPVKVKHQTYAVTK